MQQSDGPRRRNEAMEWSIGMGTPTKPSVLQTYQTVLYDRALHPELFALKDRRVVRSGAYEFEAWLTRAGHLLRFEHRCRCASELVTDQEGNLPDAGVVMAFPCAGERDYEHAFETDGINYMTTVQTECLSENLYLSAYDEITALACEMGAMRHGWDTEDGPCLSVLDIQRFSREIHAQSYHLIASGGIVLRTQTIFEHP